MSERFIPQEFLENPKPETEPESHDISRREFLKKTTTLVAGAALLGSFPSTLEAEPDRGKKIRTGALEGERFTNNLYSYLTGIEGVVPAEVNVDYKNQLMVLCDKKRDFVRREGLPKTAFIQICNDLQREYNNLDRGKMGLQEFLNTTQREIDGVKANLNWQEMQERKKLTPEKLNLLKTISESINARDLVAYGLTELMPTADGDLNINVLRFLVENAGSRYIHSVPALYDDEASFGIYQFTPYALYDDGKERRGASDINRFLERDKIPGSMKDLRGDTHHRAAILFAIYNLWFLIKKCDSNQLQALSEVWRSKHDVVIEFIAAAHHAPKYGVRGALSWLSSEYNFRHPRKRKVARRKKGKAVVLKPPREHDFVEFLPRPTKKNPNRDDIGLYALKTRANLRALRENRNRKRV